MQLLTWNDKEGKATFWHSSAHLMAEALESMYPGIKFGIGPPIEQGFYYDVDFGDMEFSGERLEEIENKMLELARQKNEYHRQDISKQDALQYFTEKGDEYKIELIGDLEDGTITLYRQGNFTDLCRGPHIPHTGFIKAVKLTNVAGAYWRGDEKNKQLTRLYGITFPKQKELKEYLHLVEEAKKRDHRKLGRELELFAFSEKVGMGLPLWLPKARCCGSVSKISSKKRKKRRAMNWLYRLILGARSCMLPRAIMKNMARTPFNLFIHRVKMRSFY